MNNHVKEFYRQPSDDDVTNSHFHRVIALHEAADVDWETVVALAPTLCKGWYELAHLDNRDRIDFTFDFWLSKIPYHPDFQKFLSRFFSSITEICVFITQKHFDDPFEANVVYCLENGSFYRGAPPVTEENLTTLKKKFPDVIFPEDYLAFLSVHDGFCKTTDSTGIIHSKEVFNVYQNLLGMIGSSDAVTTTGGTLVDPAKLIPFYESFGMPFFQCFWADWYPLQEMGNVYYSSEQKTISDVSNPDALTETMAFPTFVDWLIFYLEQIA